MKQQSKPIRVAAVGIDERTRNALRMFFKGPCNNLCVLVEEDSADTGIIDLDGYRGMELLTEYRVRHPKQPVILISLHETEVGEGVFLKKPLKPKLLIAALTKEKHKLLARTAKSAEVGKSIPASGSAEMPEQVMDHALEGVVDISKRDKKKTAAPDTHQAAMYLEEQDAKVLVGTAPDIDPKAPHQLAKAQYDPNDFLQSHLCRACKTADERNRSVRIETLRGAIHVQPKGQAVLLKLSNSRLRTLSAVPVIQTSLSVTVMQAGYSLEQNDAVIRINRNSLLWSTALWASRGRIPAGTCLDTPVFLDRWPNMTRLLLFPHALRIAALWTNQPHSLLATASNLNIPQRYVFGFYSAAHALGLASTGQRAVDILFEPAPLQKNRRQGLFGRILNRLRKK